MLGNMLSKMRLLPRVFLLGVVVIVCFLIALGLLYPEIRDSKYNARQAQIRNLVETASGILDYYSGQAKAGKMSEEEAQRAALEEIKTLRYEKDNYFWINDMYPRMVMHPIQTELDGQDLSNYEDPTGKKIFVEFVNVAKKSGTAL